MRINLFGVELLKVYTTLFSNLGKYFQISQLIRCGVHISKVVVDIKNLSINVKDFFSLKLGRYNDNLFSSNFWVDNKNLKLLFLNLYALENQNTALFLEDY